MSTIYFNDRIFFGQINFFFKNNLRIKFQSPQWTTQKIWLAKQVTKIFNHHLKKQFDFHHWSSNFLTISHKSKKIQCQFSIVNLGHWNFLITNLGHWKISIANLGHQKILITKSISLKLGNWIFQALLKKFVITTWKFSIVQFSINGWWFHLHHYCNNWIFLILAPKKFHLLLKKNSIVI
jgi:hypothetical protein